MSRRDTIIVAVLINTGLLAALFMMAMQREAPDLLAAPEAIAEASFTESVREEVKLSDSPKEQTIVAARDEIDEVLMSYSKTNTPLSASASESRQARNPETPTETEARRFPNPPPDEKFVDVTVKKGDNLEKIARLNGTTVNAIIRANQLPTARIDVGQTLRVPVGKKEESPAKAPQQPTAREVAAVEDPQYYTIKSGDNPWKIAKQFHVKFDDLLKLNGLDEAKARNLKPGDVLRVK